MVVGKKIKYQYLDTTTIPFFFTRIPNEANTTDIWSVFAKYGQVVEVFIPNKLDKWGKRFGFVKFKDVGNRKLKVNRARFGRETQQLVVQGVVEERRRTVVAAGEGPSIMTGKSFKQALGREKGQVEGRKEDRPVLMVQPSEEMLELLKWAYVGELHQNLEAKEVRQMLMMEGLSEIKVTSMGRRRSCCWLRTIMS